MLLGVEEVQKRLGVKPGAAYKFIRELNKELKEQGFITIRGKVEERYLNERFRLSAFEDEEVSK